MEIIRESCSDLLIPDTTKEARIISRDLPKLDVIKNEILH